MSKVVHLISSESHDESYVWCGSDCEERERMIKDATCHACLIAAAEFGDRARARRISLLAHPATCSTAFRGCDPECPKGKAEDGRL